MQPSPEPPRTDRLRSAWTFFRHWLRSPLTTASVVPSGEELAARMADQITADDRLVVELGPGTGALTGTLLQQLPQAAKLVAVELNADFASALAQRYPQLPVLQGDASQLAQLLADGGHDDRPVDLVLSGLGILVMPEAVTRAIIAAVFDVLAPEGRFVQFTYRPISPIAKHLLREFGLQSRQVASAWRNLPPAFVYEYRRAGLRAEG